MAKGPIAVRYAIEAITAGAEQPQADGLRLEANLFGLCFATEDMKEGTGGLQGEAEGFVPGQVGRNGARRAAVLHDDLIYDWNKSEMPGGLPARSRSTTKRCATGFSPIGDRPAPRDQGPASAPDERDGDRHGRRGAAGRRTAGGGGRDGAVQGDCLLAARHPSQLRGPHPRQRYRSDRRVLAGVRHRDRGLPLHRLLTDPHVHRGMVAGPPPGVDRAGRHHAVREGLPVMYVTEDTTRANPDTSTSSTDRHRERRRARVRLRHRRPRHPHGVARLVALHEGSDRGDGREGQDRLARAQATAASRPPTRWPPSRRASTGSTARRSGSASGRQHAPMELLLVNLRLMGWCPRRPRRAAGVLSRTSPKPARPDPEELPGRRRATRSRRRRASTRRPSSRPSARATWLANRVYSGVPADRVRARAEDHVGPMSGRSNVVFWLENRGIEPTEPRVDAIFRAAKGSAKLLEDQEMLGLIHDL